jgi:hypothetical protein
MTNNRTKVKLRNVYGRIPVLGHLHPFIPFLGDTPSWGDTHHGAIPHSSGREIPYPK